VLKLIIVYYLWKKRSREVRQALVIIIFQWCEIGWVKVELIFRNLLIFGKKCLIGLKAGGQAVAASKLKMEGSSHRSYTRWLDKIIYKKGIKFWADLSSRGCREKTSQLPKVSMFFRRFFQLFVKKKISKIHKKYFCVRTQKLHNIKLRKL